MELEFKNPVCEISDSIAGRRQIKVILHEIFPDAQHYQENGISWKEEYVRNNMASIEGMSLTVEFLDESMPYGHGMTGIRDNLPLFEDATVVGHFASAAIENVNIAGIQKRVLIADGVIDEMRYPHFVEWLKEHMDTGVVHGSVEIVGKAENDNHIVYEDGWKEEGRVPMEYDYSGYAILSVKPADASAVVLELNNKYKNEQKEVGTMNEEMKNEFSEVKGTLSEVNEAIQSVITAKDAEINSLKEESSKIQANLDDTNAKLDEKNAEINTLNEKIAEQTAEIDSLNATIAELNASIDTLKKDAAVAELNAALAKFTDEQKAYAKEDIDKYNENPSSVEVNTIVGKICTQIFNESHDDIDIFSAISDASAGNEEINVF